MTRHLIDRTKPRDDTFRLTRFLRVARQEGRRVAAEMLLRRPRSRNPHSGRVAGMLKPQRGE